MKQLRSQYIRLSILSILFLISVVILYPTVRNLIGLQNLTEISSSKGYRFREGKYVKVTYECVLDAGLSSYRYYEPSIFYLLRMPEKEEYMVVAIHTEEPNAWDGCDFFDRAIDSTSFISKERHSFVGRVEELSTSQSRTLSRRVEQSDEREPEYASVHTLENTNLRYYVNEMNTKTELAALKLKLPWVILLAILWIRRFFLLRRLKEAVQAVDGVGGEGK